MTISVVKLVWLLVGTPWRNGGTTGQDSGVVKTRVGSRPGETVRSVVHPGSTKDPWTLPGSHPGPTEPDVFSEGFGTTLGRQGPGPGSHPHP